MRKVEVYHPILRGGNSRVKVGDVVVSKNFMDRRPGGRDFGRVRRNTEAARDEADPAAPSDTAARSRLRAANGLHQRRRDGRRSGRSGRPGRFPERPTARGEQQFREQCASAGARRPARNSSSPRRRGGSGAPDAAAVRSCPAETRARLHLEKRLLAMGKRLGVGAGPMGV